MIVIPKYIVHIMKKDHAIRNLERQCLAQESRATIQGVSDSRVFTLAC